MAHACSPSGRRSEGGHRPVCTPGRPHADHGGKAPGRRHQSNGISLATARLVVNEMKGTVRTSMGMRPDLERAGAMWDNVADHEGFVLAGCPRACDDQSIQAPTPIPMGSASLLSASSSKGLKSSANCHSTSKRSPTMRKLAYRQSRQRAVHSGSASRREDACSGRKRRRTSACQSTRRC